MEPNSPQKESNPRPNRKYLRVILLVAIIGGIVVLVCDKLPDIVIGILQWYTNLNISYQESQDVNTVMTYTYPNATMIRADGESYHHETNTDDYAVISLTVTFETSDSFNMVKNWYIQHPRGGTGGGLFCEGCTGTEYQFPNAGLRQVDEATPGKTRYEVDYTTIEEGCEFTQCTTPFHEIR